MLADDQFSAVPFEIKTATDSTGEFTGYGAFFGNRDFAKDRILPGAFTDTLASRNGRAVLMHLNHGLPEIGGQFNVGLWKTLTEDSKGLEVHGRISGMSTDTGRYLYERARDGVFPGLSIGFKVAPGGSSLANGERTLSKLDLYEISLASDPCNERALITNIKSRFEQKTTMVPAAATAAIAAAIALHQKVMQGGDAPTAAERAQLMSHMQDAHEALTGQRVPLEGKADMQRLLTEMAEMKALIAVFTTPARPALLTAEALGWT